MTQLAKPATKAVATPKPVGIEGLIAQAIQNNSSVETLERLFDLRVKVNTEKAKEAFVEALGNFQREVPVIEKTKSVLNKDGRTMRYKYAPMDSVIGQIKKTLSDNGFSYNWDSKNLEKHIEVTCKLTHKLGHSETSTFAIPIVESQFMTSPQSYATAQSYAKRYTLLNVLGIGTADEDTDSTDTGKDKDAKSVKARIIFLLRQLGAEAKTKEELEKVVKEKVQLDLVEANFSDIVARLEVLVDEKNNASN